jgi:hypothetical protein
MLDSLTTSDLLAKICYLCESNSAFSAISYENKVDLSKSDMIEFKTVLEKYRDELIARISDADTVMERATLTQAYYRLVTTLRSIHNHVVYLDDIKNVNNIAGNLTLAINTSFSQLDNLNLARAQDN